MGIKADPTWKPDSQGISREVKVQTELKADTSSDLRLKYALQRRSLALDQARLCGYDKLERWSAIFVEAYSRPADGYKKVTIDQIQHADMETFKFLIRRTRAGVRPSLGSVPVEEVSEVGMAAQEIRLHLQPLPVGSGKKRDEHDDVEKPEKRAKKDTSKTERLRRQVENLQGQVQNLQKGKGHLHALWRGCLLN